MAEAAGEIRQSGKSMQDVGRNLTTHVTLPLVALGAGALAASADWETAMVNVAKTVDAPTAQIERMGEAFIALSESTPTSSGELARIGSLAGQLGIETENIVAFSKVMADLGVTTNLSSDQAATSLARLANITQMPQTEFDRLGAVIVDLGNNFATTEAEITEFGLRIAGAGEIAGLTEANILAIGAAMSSVGVEAEAGGTAVQKVLLGMTQAVADGNKDLKVFAATAGLTVQEFSKAFKEDAAEAFTLFVEGLGRQGTEAFKTLEALNLQDQRLIRSFLSLAGAGDELRQAVARGNTAWTENRALTDEAEKFYATLSNRLKTFRNQVVNTAAELGNALRPAFEQLMAAAVPVLGFARDAVEVFASMPAPAQAVAIALAGIAAATGPLLVVLGTLLRSLAAVTGALARYRVAADATAASNVRLGASWRAALGPIVIVAAAMKTVKDVADGSANSIQKLWAAFTPIGPLGLSIRTAAKSWENLHGRMAATHPVADKVSRVFDWLTGKTKETAGEADNLTKSLEALGAQQAEVIELTNRLSGAVGGRLQQAINEAGIAIRGTLTGQMDATFRSTSRAAEQWDAAKRILGAFGVEVGGTAGQVSELNSELGNVVVPTGGGGGGKSEVQSMIDALSRQAALLGKTEAEALAYDLAMNKASASQVALAQSLRALIDQYERVEGPSQRIREGLAEELRGIKALSDALAGTGIEYDATTAAAGAYEVALRAAAQIQGVSKELVDELTAGLKEQQKALLGVAAAAQAANQREVRRENVDRHEGKLMDFAAQQREMENEKLKQQMEEQRQLAERIAGSFADAFASVITGTESVSEAFRKMAQEIISELIRIQIQKAIIEPLMGMMFPSLGEQFSGGIDFGGGVPIPALAAGGDVTAHMPHLVGEQGPELFIPGAAGRIEPDFGGGETYQTTVNFTIQANDTQTGAEFVRRYAPEITNEVARRLERTRSLRRRTTRG